MRIIAVFLIILTVPAIVHSATLKVPSQYPTIQDAIDAAVNGDTVLVAPGTYVENINFKGKAITLTSEQGAAVTFIDGNQAGSVVTCGSGEGADTVLDGFTIANGSGTIVSTTYILTSIYGGGMYNSGSSPTVTNCTFSENRALGKSADFGLGGGIFNDGGATVTNCNFTGNAASAEGGGMYNGNSSPAVTNCAFSGNTAEFGGGMFNWGGNPTPTVTNCIFNENEAWWQGGGMYNCDSSPTVTNCTFSENTASEGGGMYNSGGSPAVANCTFSRNLAWSYFWPMWCGGGMCNFYSSPTVTNCTFIENTAEYYGGGMCNAYSKPTVTNDILWNDTPDEIYNYDSYPIITYSCIQGGYPGIGNIDSDPLFVDPTNEDFHLTWISPCINRGTNVDAPADDIEGDPRPYMGTVDMGADEFTGTHPLEVDVYTLPEAGGTVKFNLNGKIYNGGRNYIIVGSISGTAPGMLLSGGTTLPVNWDVFTNIMMQFLNTHYFQNFGGSLSPFGNASAILDTGGSIKGNAGITLSFAYCCNNPFDFVSNPVAIEIVP